MNEAAIHQKLNEVIGTLRASPVAGLSTKVGSEGCYVSDVDSERVGMDQKLANLHLQVKYLLFDLEATKRENRYLLQMLEARRWPKREKDRDGGSSQF